MKFLLIVSYLFITLVSQSQIILIDEHFSNSSPSTWSSTSNVWLFNNNGAPTGNFRNVFDNTKYAARFPSAANGNSIYIYIPINFLSDKVYTITFYTKRACSVVVNSNELPNQTTLLTTDTELNTNCNSNWSLWYKWSFTIAPIYTGSGFIQIWIKTVYGGPASVYLDDITIYESPITSLPIELLYFKGEKTFNGNILKWETASETNNDYFTLYRSTYPINWIPIAKIDGAGNSIMSNKYEFIDYEFNNDINYYMLRQTDYDNKFEESEIIAIDNIRPIIEPIKAFNIIGQEVPIDYDGLKFVIYNDGSTKKVN